MTYIDTALYVHNPNISYICSDQYTDMIVIVSVAWFWPDDVNYINLNLEGPGNIQLITENKTYGNGNSDSRLKNYIKIYRISKNIAHSFTVTAKGDSPTSAYQIIRFGL